MTKELNYEGVPVTPSQNKAIQKLRDQISERLGDAYEFKRFEVYPFSSARILEVFIEVGKVEESALEAISSRTVRQIYIGERGGCELVNASNPKKNKGLKECVESFTV